MSTTPRRCWIEARPAPTPPRALPGYDPLAAVASRGAAAHPVYDVVKGVGLDLVAQGYAEADAKHGGELKNGALVKILAGADRLARLVPYERAKKVDISIDTTQSHEARVEEMNAALAGIKL